MNSKRLTTLGILPWLVMSIFSIALYPATFELSCFFQSNWIFCPVEPSMAMKFVSFGLIFSFIAGLMITGRLFWKRFISDDAAAEGHYKIAAMAFVVLAILIVPFGSGDVSYYFSAGKALDAGINPYGDDWTLTRHFVGPQRSETLNTFSYGPIMARMFRAFYLISFDNAAIFALIWKVFVALAFAICGILTFKLLSLLGTDISRSRFFLFWFLQPLFLFEALSSGHFDVIWISIVLLAIWAAIRNNWWLVFPLLTVGVWMKFIPLLMMPFFALWWWNETSRENWKNRVAQLAIAAILSAVVTVVSWWSLWSGPQAFQAVTLQYKLAISSLFALIYYSLRPLFDIILEAKAHWYLTRIVNVALLCLLFYSFYPFIKKGILVFLKKARLSADELIQMIFFWMLLYLFIWQKSLWPWYPIWLIPIGIMIFERTRNVELRRILTWLSLAPLGFYPIWHIAWLIKGADSASQYWFWWLFVSLVWAYPLYNLFKLRRINFNLEIKK